MCDCCSQQESSQSAAGGIRTPRKLEDVRGKERVPEDREDRENERKTGGEIMANNSQNWMNDMNYQIEVKYCVSSKIN